MNLRLQRRSHLTHNSSKACREFLAMYLSSPADGMSVVFWQLAMEQSQLSTRNHRGY